MTLNMRIYVCHEPIAGRYSQYCWAAIDLRPRLRDSLYYPRRPPVYSLIPLYGNRFRSYLLLLPAAAVVFSLSCRCMAAIRHRDERGWADPFV